ncbi:hypothetical protein, partial [Sulfuricurvum sp.]|uniref:hypothetical protein n=1 Tax=Sulfuricurvum sp. TaxID=2025608 RepID=UPI00262253CC
MINKLFLRWIVLFGLCSTFALSAISADTLPEVDDFNSDTEGWTGANVSWNSSGKRLFINHDNFASKTYDFGVENANQIVSIELKVTEISSWENDDHLQVRVDGTTNGIPVLDETVNGTSEMHTFSAVLDKNGQLKMTITPNTSDNAEDIYIEKITISASANNYSKSYTPDFFLRKQLYAKGNMKMIGNTVLVAPTTQNSSTICTSYTNGSFIPNATNTNDEYYLCGYSVDGNQINATRSELNIPKTSKILWAGLYWQALIKTTDFSTSQTIKIRNDANGSNSYKSISPDRLYYMESGYSSTTAYSAFKDVTSLFTENGWVDGNYTVANIPVYEGKLSNLGTYGAWSLTVIYEDTSEQYRSFSVYDGWDRVSNSRDVTISPSGFYTPNRLLVTAEAKVSLFTAEGDKNIDGDTLETKNYRTNSSVTLPASSNNTFISTISGGGSRTPNAVNNQGIDIQTYEIGDLLEKKQTDMDFTLTSTGDVYWPSVIAFSTVLIAPELCYDYSFKQNGAYLKASNTGNQLPLLSGYISDAALETTIYIRNKDADILAQGLSFYTDVNTSMFNYINNSVETSNVNGSILIPRIPDATASCNYTTAGTTNIGCDSGADIRIGLGNGATGYGQYEGGSLSNKEFVYAKFSMDPVGVNRIADINQSLGLKLNYYIVPKTGATPIPYDYTFGDEIKLCPPSSGYAPTWGTFNVVDRNAPTYGAYSLPINNLHTQVSRKPFDVDVAAYGDDGSKTYNIRPTADINTTVLVEMIDNDAFHDANASCANPDSNVSQAIYVPLTITGGLTGDMTDLELRR